MKQTSVILSAVILMNFFFLSQSTVEVVYKRYHRRRPVTQQLRNGQTQVKYVEEIKEVFKTKQQPPPFGASKAAIESFLKCDHRCKARKRFGAKARRKPVIATSTVSNEVYAINTTAATPSSTTVQSVMSLAKNISEIVTIRNWQEQQHTRPTTPSIYSTPTSVYNRTTIRPQENRKPDHTQLRRPTPPIIFIRYNESSKIPIATIPYTEFNRNWSPPITTTTTTTIRPTSTTQSNDEWLRNWFYSFASSTEPSTAKHLSIKTTEMLANITKSPTTTTVRNTFPPRTTQQTTEFNWSWLLPNITLTTKRPISVGNLTTPMPVLLESTTKSNDGWMSTESSTMDYFSTKKTEILSKLPSTTLSMLPTAIVTGFSNTSTKPTTLDDDGSTIESTVNNEENEEYVYDGDDDEDEDEDDENNGGEPLEDDTIIEDEIGDNDDYEDDYENNKDADTH